eukprot:15804681-Heterocapsa_arctica.AAC.1
MNNNFCSSYTRKRRKSPDSDRSDEDNDENLSLDTRSGRKLAIEWWKTTRIKSSNNRKNKKLRRLRKPSS